MIFPPETIEDINNYDIEECKKGYLEYKKEDLDPGDNFSSAYRWGWANRKYDLSNGQSDEYFEIRKKYIEYRIQQNRR